MNAVVVSPNSNAEIFRASTDAAGLCREIVLQTAMEIQNRRYVKVEGWQAIAIAHGCTGSARDVEEIEGGVRAIGEIRRMSDGALIAQAEGFVGRDEPTWYGGEVESDVWEGPRGNRRKTGRKEVKTLPKRPDYAIRAMAQTRAISRACRSAFAHVVVLIDANLSTTPAEEVPYGGFDDAPATPRDVTPAKPSNTPKASASVKVDWRTLDDEMDACKSQAELDAWNGRREREIKALPKGQFDALGAKFQGLYEGRPASVAPSQSTNAFDLSEDEIPEFA